MPTVTFTRLSDSLVRSGHKCANVLGALRTLWQEGNFAPWACGSFEISQRVSPVDVAVDTGYVISRVEGNSVAVIHRVPGHLPGIAGLFSGRRPAFVDFRANGYYTQPYFDETLSAAQALVVNRYVGMIECYSKMSSDESAVVHCAISLTEQGLNVRLEVRVTFANERDVSSLLAFLRDESFVEG